MELYGQNYGFKLTVGAACEIADKCPGGELKNFRQLILGPFRQASEGRAELICVLSRGWSEARHFETGEAGPTLTPALLRTLEPKRFEAVFVEAMGAFKEGLATSVALGETKKDGEDAGSGAAP